VPKSHGLSAGTTEPTIRFGVAPRRVTRSMSVEDGQAIWDGAALRLTGDGDRARVRRVAGRLSAPVVLGRDLLLRCSEVPAARSSLRTVAFEAHQGETLCEAHGRLELATTS